MQPSPMSESYTSVNRRPMDVEDYFDIVRRHKGWIFGPAFAALVVATVVACLWPDTYVSTGTIRVVPPQVPESIVPTNINSRLSQRINSMYQTVTSRENLTNIINLHGLYKREKANMPMDDVVEQMRSGIRMSSVVPLATQGDRQISAFQISFSYENRIIAKNVTEALVSRFIDENTRERTSQSISTTQFLKDQLENAKKDLDSIEEKLTNFRTTSNGRLPDQIQQNSVQMNMLEQRIANLNGGLGRISQDKMLLEADLRSLKIQRAALTPGPENIVRKQKNDRLEQVDREIMQLEGLLSNLRQHYRDTYPDVRRVKAQLTTAQKRREKILSEEEVQSDDSLVAAKRMDPMYEREARQLDAGIERVEAQLKAKDTEAKQYAADIANAEKGIRLVQSRIESTPVSEQQYGDIIRDREVAKLKYDDLNRKRSQSQISEDLERRQQGETLEILDRASLPQTPTQPKRGYIIGAGVAMGLVLGLFMAGAREAKDTSLKNLKDVRAYTQLAILGSVPLLENDVVVRRRKRLIWLAWSTACLVGIAVMTASAFYYYVTKV